MTLILTIVIALWGFFMSFILGNMLYNDNKDNFTRLFIETGIFGALIALICFIQPKLLPISTWGPAWSAFCAIAVVAAIATILSMVRNKAATFAEHVVATLLVVPLLFIVVAFNYGGLVLLEGHIFWYSIVNALPWIVILGSLAFIWANYFFRKAMLLEKGWPRFVAVAIIIVAGIILLVILANRIRWDKIGEGANPSTTTTSETVTAAETTAAETTTVAETTTAAEEKGEYVFYNLLLQNDGDNSNNFNFGPHGFANATENEKTATYADSEFYRRCSDPSFLAAQTTYVDWKIDKEVLNGSMDYLLGGLSRAEFMENHKQKYLDDFSAFGTDANLLKKFFDENTVEMGITKINQKGMESMFMTPYTVDGIPVVFVGKTEDKEVEIFWRKVRVKHKIVTFYWCIDCGFQPIEDKIEIPTTSKKTTTTTTTTTTTEEDQKKDKNRGPNSGPGDTGNDPGPDTNNGPGSNEPDSTKNKPDTSDVPNVDDAFNIWDWIKGKPDDPQDKPDVPDDVPSDNPGEDADVDPNPNTPPATDKDGNPIGGGDGMVDPF